VIKILIVDDELYMRSILTKVIKAANYHTVGAENGREAIALFKKTEPDIVLLDYKLPDINGLEVLQELKKIRNDFNVIMLTAHGNVKDAVKAIKIGAYHYLTKPFDNEELLIEIEKACDHLKLNKENKFLKKQIKTMKQKQKVIGESKAFQQIFDQVEVVARTAVTVLLQGETGTGKEVIARLIHQKSEMSEGPFVAVDCGAVPETLFESELFGFEKGAFTGASKDRIGKFEQANHGTIFLDEINNLPMKLQAKLLRVIEERTINKIGSQDDVTLDVRVIAASNKDIVEDVNAGKFRKDLFYRINEYRIEIPPLRKRKDDITPLLQHYINEYNVSCKKSVSGIEPAALNILLQHDWPGNIREFRNVVQRAVLTASRKIRVKDINITHNLGNGNKNNSYILSEVKEDTEKELIQKALTKAKGRKTDAADILNISRRQLYRKLKKHDLL
jgi:two-component system response regulator AtoC